MCYCNQSPDHCSQRLFTVAVGVENPLRWTFASIRHPSGSVGGYLTGCSLQKGNWTIAYQLQGSSSTPIVSYKDRLSMSEALAEPARRTCRRLLRCFTVTQEATAIQIHCRTLDAVPPMRHHSPNLDTPTIGDETGFGIPDYVEARTSNVERTIESLEYRMN